MSSGDGVGRRVRGEDDEPRCVQQQGRTKDLPELDAGLTECAAEDRTIIDEAESVIEVDGSEDLLIRNEVAHCQLGGDGARPPDHIATLGTLASETD